MAVVTSAAVPGAPEATREAARHPSAAKAMADAISATLARIALPRSVAATLVLGKALLRFA